MSAASATGLGNPRQVADSVARVLDLRVEMLHLIVGALELCAPQAQLITLGTVGDGLGSTALLEVALAQMRQRDHELRLHQAIDVLSIDAVNSLPLDINKTRVAHDDIIIGQFQIDGHFLGIVPGHCCLGVLGAPVDKFKEGQKCSLEDLLDCGTFIAFHAKVIEDELEFIGTPHAHSIDLSTKIEHDIEKHGELLL